MEREILNLDELEEELDYQVGRGKLDAGSFFCQNMIDGLDHQINLFSFCQSVFV